MTHVKDGKGWEGGPRVGDVLVLPWGKGWGGSPDGNVVLSSNREVRLLPLGQQLY